MNDSNRILHQADIVPGTIKARHLSLTEGLPIPAKSSDPANPAKNNAVIWLSDGTGGGDNGDLMIKITDSGGTTKTATIIDFSAV